VKFANWLHEFAKKESSSWVKAKDVYTNELEISSRSWTDVKKDPEVLALMSVLGISFKGQKIVREEN
jgi:hypothetical protein